MKTRTTTCIPKTEKNEAMKDSQEKSQEAQKFRQDDPA